MSMEVYPCPWPAPPRPGEAVSKVIKAGKVGQKSNSIKTSRKTARPPGAMKTSATIPGARNGAFATSGDKRPNIKTCQLLLSLLPTAKRGKS